MNGKEEKAFTQQWDYCDRDHNAFVDTTERNGCNQAQ